MPKNALALAPRDLLILATLAEQACHGYGLIKQVEQRSGDGSSSSRVQLDPANLYRVLRRMRRDKWVEESVEPESGGAGRRKVYAITDMGREVLSHEVERLEQLLRQTRPALASNRD